MKRFSFQSAYLLHTPSASGKEMRKKRLGRRYMGVLGLLMGVLLFSPFPADRPVSSPGVAQGTLPAVPRNFPQVATQKMQQLEQFISQMPPSSRAYYQDQMRAYQLSFSYTTTAQGAQLVLYTMDQDIEKAQTETAHAEAVTQIQRFHQEVEHWSKQHPYQDQYDGHSYALNNGYMGPGIGASLDQSISLANTSDAYQEIAQNAANDLFLEQLLEKDSQDKTSYDQTHSTDLQLLQHFHLQNTQVLVVSLAEQVLRVYQHGKLERAFYVTTGRQELPTLPGIWPVLERRSPVNFYASADPKSPFWFPDTPIQYALLYHLGGYFLHDASWRGSFGPGTEFPHQDDDGNTPYNENGSHGCINVQPDDMGWLYQHTNDNTVVAIY